jgi:NifB/MoaA-like Fe-S oxidoreductase
LKLTTDSSDIRTANRQETIILEKRLNDVYYSILSIKQDLRRGDDSTISNEMEPLLINAAKEVKKAKELIRMLLEG